MQSHSQKYALKRKRKEGDEGGVPMHTPMHTHRVAPLLPLPYEPELQPEDSSLAEIAKEKASAALNAFKETASAALTSLFGSTTAANTTTTNTTEPAKPPEPDETVIPPVVEPVAEPVAEPDPADAGGVTGVEPLVEPNDPERSMLLYNKLIKFGLEGDTGQAMRDAALSGDVHTLQQKLNELEAGATTKPVVVPPPDLNPLMTAKIEAIDRFYAQRPSMRHYDDTNGHLEMYIRDRTKSVAFVKRYLEDLAITRFKPTNSGPPTYNGTNFTRTVQNTNGKLQVQQEGVINKGFNWFVDTLSRIPLQYEDG